MNERKTIYLDDAIDALIRVRKPINNGDGTMTIMTLTDAVIRKVLEGLPSAQPMQTDKDFEKQIHAMFDHIWDCEIEHPIFQDTVGELMEAVIQAHNNSAQPKIIRCENCMFYKTDDDIFPDRQDWCEMWESGTVAYGYCYHAERKENEQY